MTRPCPLCHLYPAEPGRSVCTVCRREQRRTRALANAKAHRAKPQPMTVEEFEAQWEAAERGRKVEL